LTLYISAYADTLKVTALLRTLLKWHKRSMAVAQHV